MMTQMIAKKIKLARKEAFFSQIALANMIGVSQNAVHKWETGKSSPDYDTLATIARVTGKSLEWFLFELESKGEREDIKRNKSLPLLKDTEQPDKYVIMDPSVKFFVERVGLMEKENSELSNKIDRLIQLMEQQVAYTADLKKEMADVKKNTAEAMLYAQQSERLAEVAYLLEIGEISAEQAGIDLKRLKNIK